jgi:hypothetical protein
MPRDSENATVAHSSVFSRFLVPVHEPVRVVVRSSIASMRARLRALEEKSHALGVVHELKDIRDDVTEASGPLRSGV